MHNFLKMKEMSHFYFMHEFIKNLSYSENFQKIQDYEIGGELVIATYWCKKVNCLVDNYICY